MSFIRKLWAKKGEAEPQSTSENPEDVAPTLILGPRVVNRGQFDTVIE